MRPIPLATAAILGLALLAPAQAAISLNNGSLAYSQDFNSLANVNGSDTLWSNDASLAGWHLQAGAALEYSPERLRVSTSSGSDRAHISYGRNGVSERALGMQGGSSHRYSPVEPGVGEAFGAIAVAFVNGGSATLDGFSFGYTGEQWHVSTNANTAHSLTVQYALGAAGSPAHTLSWTGLAGADFHSPTLSGGTTGNGNLAANRITGLGATVTGLQWQTGQTLWLRWVDINDPASDHGLAIDDFSFTASVSAVPEPGIWGLMLAGLAGLGWRARRRAV